MQQTLIVEDVPEAHNWIIDGVSTAFPDTVISSAFCARDANELLDKHDYNLALIDLQLPDGSGVDLIERIKHATPATVCVVVSIYDDDQHLFPALQAGAGGYLLKDMPFEQFVRRLRGVLDNDPPLSPAIARRLLSHFSDSRPMPEHNLTSREREVLTLIAKGNKLTDVASSLSISPHTAADHVKNIYRKLNISSRAEASLEATRLGLITPP
ncbi:response regulator [Sedimenticola sp.]|uniref:response regulator n=1 Tax=Sedimenticola sp. TaxID=1940285 RepID=UPI003D0B37A1